MVKEAIVEVEVPCRTLNEELQRLNIPPPTVLLVDAEGFDCGIVSDAMTLSCPIAQYEETHCTPAGRRRQGRLYCRSDRAEANVHLCSTIAGRTSRAGAMLPSTEVAPTSCLGGVFYQQHHLRRLLSCLMPRPTDQHHCANSCDRMQTTAPSFTHARNQRLARST